MLEKEVEKLLVKKVKDLGGMAYKFVSPGNSGVPDRIVLFPDGKIIFVELKTDKGVISKLQERQINRIKNFGQDVSILFGKDGVESFIKKYESSLK